MPGSVPSIEEISAQPLRARELSAEAAAVLLAQCGTAQGALLAALATPRRPAVPEVHEDRLLKVEDVAEALGFSKGHTYEMVRSGKLTAVHNGRTWRVRSDALKQFITENEGLDTSLNKVLSRLDDQRRVKASAKKTRPRANAARRKAGGPSDDDQSVGARSRQDSGSNLATDPALGH